MGDHTHLLETEKAVHLALSRFLGTQGGSRAMARPLGVIVQAIAGDGEPSWRPAGRDPLRSVGLTPRKLDSQWAVARANGQLLPREVIEAYFPAIGWPQFKRVLSLGPQTAVQQAEAVLSCWAQGLEADGSARSCALSTKSIDTYITALHRFLREVCEIRKLASSEHVDAGASLFDGWELHLIPKRAKPEELGAREANSDRSAPSLRAIRLALRALDREVQLRKKNKYGQRHMARELRNRALLATFVTVGGRLGAVAALKRGDFIRFHQSQGYEGPALMLRPGKGLHADLVRTKFIPRELGEWIQEWIEYVGTHDEPEAGLWVRSKECMSRCSRSPFDH